jgi:Uma2 family endonuclease
MEALDPDRNEYPESDGQPMADNTLQFRWIVVLKENLDAALPDFVAGDLLWYPVRGEPWIRAAPDVLVALGRPKGDRGSYRQWEEDGVGPQVVFEVLSPGNTEAAMGDKLAFYDRYGVQEYYVVDPDVQTLEAFVRRDGALRQVPVAPEHRSRLLGIRFVRRGEQLTVHGPGGEPFRTFPEILAERDAATAERDAANARAARLAARLRAMGVDPDNEEP